MGRSIGGRFMARFWGGRDIHDGGKRLVTTDVKGMQRGYKGCKRDIGWGSHCWERDESLLRASAMLLGGALKRQLARRLDQGCLFGYTAYGDGNDTHDSTKIR
jgi:hypothetical protein